MSTNKVSFANRDQQITSVFHQLRIVYHTLYDIFDTLEGPTDDCPPLYTRIYGQLDRMLDSRIWTPLRNARGGRCAELAERIDMTGARLNQYGKQCAVVNFCRG